VFSFIETRLFTRLIQKYMAENEYRKLQSVLMSNPEIGDIVPGSGGVANSVGARRAEENAVGIA